MQRTEREPLSNAMLCNAVELASIPWLVNIIWKKYVEESTENVLVSRHYKTLSTSSRSFSCFWALAIT